MPELPEVEIIRLQLQKYLVGHKIEEAEVRTAKIFSGNKENVEGAKIEEVRRFAKVLSIDLSNGYSIVIHVKLTGQLIYKGPRLTHFELSKKVIGGAPGKHTHLIFYLDKGGILYYNDVRRFGWVKVIKSKDLTTDGFLGKLGPEPFGSAQGKPSLTLEYFEKICKSTLRPIKILLMDQSKIGGIGNIYANDALFLAKIRPERKANSLSSSEAELLFKSIEKVLKEGIKRGGASELAFVTPDGSEGHYQNYFLVYGRKGQLCKSCKKERIKKVFLAGRGTYFCPKCQK